MSLVKPMPSPTGRNAAGLYILRGVRDPDVTAAYDEDGPDDTGNPATLAKWCLANMSPEQITELVAILNTAPTDATDKRMAKDAARYCRPLSGLGAGPRPAGRATQRAQDEFHAMFPTAARVRQL